MVTRTHTNKKEIRVSLTLKKRRNKDLYLKKIIQNNNLIKRILAYSAEKIKANPPPP
jgi:hypothetical protein